MRVWPDIIPPQMTEFSRFSLKAISIFFSYWRIKRNACSMYRSITMQRKNNVLDDALHAKVLSVIPCMNDLHAMQSLAICFPNKPPLSDCYHTHLLKGHDLHVIQAKPSQAMQLMLLPLQSSNSVSWNRCNPLICFSEFPIFSDRFDCPIKLLSQCLGEELFNRHVKLLGEDHGKTRIDVILRVSISTAPNMKPRKHSQS